MILDLRSQHRPPRELSGMLHAPAWKLSAKRTIDVVATSLLIVVLLPVLVLTYLAVRLTSPGPAFYVQTRVGRNGTPFRMFKFRSMYRNAHVIKDQMAELNEAEGPVFKIRHDPRITPVGRVIRKLSIDELPQLFNVVLGHMSLVGPRPPLPEEVATYGPRERQRLLANPGITCIWQVSGRADLDFDTWIDMDLEYIDTWSIWNDLILLVKTIPAVVTGRGAY